jgi:hypothetical protein
VALTADGPWVLTEPDGGQAALRRVVAATGLEPLNCPAVGT